MDRRRLLRALGAAGATLVAGCAGGDAGAGATTTATETPEPTTATDESDGTTTASDGGATVRVAPTDEYGDVLVDADGLTLYLFTADEGSESSCYSDCATNWPPLTVDGKPTAGDGVTAALGTTERRDGARQATAAGRPLYYFAGDEAPGDTNGQGVGDAWYVLSPDGSAVGMTGTETETTTEGADPY